jgi:putative peptidoglycan lipid II flippase
VNIVVSVALYKPFGIPGIVIGTAASSAAMTLAQVYFLRRELHGRLEGRETLVAVAQMVAAAALLAAVSYGAWRLLDAWLGRGLPGQTVAVGVALTAGGVAYAVTVRLLGIPEARQIERLLAGRLFRRGAG